MSLVDEWDRGAGNLVATVTAAVLVRYAFAMKSLYQPAGPVITGITIYIAGVGVLLAAVSVTSVDLREHGRLLAAIVLSVLLGSFYVFYLAGLSIPVPGPDAQLFSVYGVDLLMTGSNPYEASMTPAWNQLGTTSLSVTPRTDGSHVTSFSYPAGALLAFVPQHLLEAAGVTTDPGFTTGITAIALLVVLVAYSPDAYALAPVPLLMAQDVVKGSFLGLVDVLWVVPVLVAIRYWYHDHYRGAAIAMGVATATKQQPWFIVPFLGLWLLLDADSHGEFLEHARTTLSWGLGTFLAINLPFIVWAPRAWVTSVLTPLAPASASLVTQGLGLSLLTASGTVLLPKGYYIVVLGVTGVWTLLLYAVFYPRARAVAWFMPALLLFVHYRSLYSYFQFSLIVAYWVMLHEWELARETPALLPADASRRLRGVVPRG